MRAIGGAGGGNRTGTLFAGRNHRDWSPGPHRKVFGNWLCWNGFVSFASLESILKETLDLLHADL